MSIVNKLEKLKNTKKAIKQALINKGVEVSDNDSFESYADKIDSIKVSDVDYIETGKIISVEE